MNSAPVNIALCGEAVYGQSGCAVVCYSVVNGRAGRAAGEARGQVYQIRSRWEGGRRQ